MVAPAENGCIHASARGARLAGGEPVMNQAPTSSSFFLSQLQPSGARHCFPALLLRLPARVWLCVRNMKRIIQNLSKSEEFVIVLLVCFAAQLAPALVTALCKFANLATPPDW